MKNLDPSDLIRFEGIEPSTAHISDTIQAEINLLASLLDKNHNFLVLSGLGRKLAQRHRAAQTPLGRMLQRSKNPTPLQFRVSQMPSDEDTGILQGHERVPVCIGIHAGKAPNRLDIVHRIGERLIHKLGVTDAAVAEGYEEFDADDVAFIGGLADNINRYVEVGDLPHLDPNTLSHIVVKPE